MEIIGVIVAGIIIGLLGKFVAPATRTTFRSGSRAVRYRWRDHRLVRLHRVRRGRQRRHRLGPLDRGHHARPYWSLIASRR